MMNYAYDILVNYSDINNDIYFFEWGKEDIIFNIKKIPVIRISSSQLDELNNYRVKINKDFLNKIKDKTFTDNKFIKFSCLVTDLERVICLSFNYDGILMEKSYLLLDEEEEVISESNMYKEEYLNYKVLDKCIKNNFLTRKDKYRQKYLLNELKELYDDKMFDEINYLYKELYSDNKSISDMYNFLIKDITSNYNNSYNKLFEIIKMT